jgi:hypothetical protein
VALASGAGVATHESQDRLGVDRTDHQQGGAAGPPVVGVELDEIAAPDGGQMAGPPLRGVAVGVATVRGGERGAVRHHAWLVEVVDQGRHLPAAELLDRPGREAGARDHVGQHVEDPGERLDGRAQPHRGGVLVHAGAELGTEGLHLGVDAGPAAAPRAATDGERGEMGQAEAAARIERRPGPQEDADRGERHARAGGDEHGQAAWEPLSPDDRGHDVLHVALPGTSVTTERRSGAR